MQVVRVVCIAWSARSVHLIAAGVQEGNAPGLIVERIAAPSVVCSALVICPIKKGLPAVVGGYTVAIHDVILVGCPRRGWCCYRSPPAPLIVSAMLRARSL